MLGDPLADGAGGDQQKPVDTLERGLDRCRVVVVEPAGHHAPRGEAAQPVGVAGGGDDVARRHAPVEKRLDCKGSEIAGGAGHEEGHGFVSWCVVSRPVGSCEL
jgi:hypothetical protein